MYKQLLIPLDESQLSMQVLESGVRMAEVHGAHVTFLYLSPQDNEVNREDAGLLHAMAPELFARKYLWRDGYIKARATGWARTANISADFISEVCDDSIADTILAKATELQADLILMGTHWRRSLIERLFGSVLLKVVQQTRIPVLVAAVGEEQESAQQQVIREFRENHAIWIALIEQLELCLQESDCLTKNDELVGMLLTAIQNFALVIRDFRQEPALQQLHQISDNVSATHTDTNDNLPQESRLIAALMDVCLVPEKWNLDVARATARQLGQHIIQQVTEDNHHLVSKASEQLSEQDFEQALATLNQTQWRALRKARQQDLGTLLSRLNTEMNRSKT
ncbi:universal stress protein [Oceanobacter antarcticus]|uniref:Universal stress protein n=1 Tax=Oceanobacter antarcticus TaxID=3133425 RepID=A0ABW8NP42_9GAMM